MCGNHDSARQTTPSKDFEYFARFGGNISVHGQMAPGFNDNALLDSSANDRRTQPVPIISQHKAAFMPTTPSEGEGLSKRLRTGTGSRPVLDGIIRSRTGIILDSHALPLRYRPEKSRDWPPIDNLD